MAITLQPLLYTPKSSPCKTLYLVLSLVAIISSTALLSVHLIKISPHDHTTLLTRICDQAYDRASCLAMVSELIASSDATQTKEKDLLQIFLKRSIPHIQKASETAKNAIRHINDRRDQSALVDCVELMDTSMERTMDSIASLENKAVKSKSDAHTWLSSVLTNYVTCLDGLKGPARSIVEPELKDLISRASTSLAMIVAIPSAGADDELLRLGLPSWISTRDRKLLDTMPKAIEANVTVAQDGSGQYTTLTEAIAATPNRTSSRYIIYVKNGTYEENVEVTSSKTNVMIVGDGMDKTIITGSLNFVDGTPTFDTPTVVGRGDGFMAQDIWFQNTAGPEKMQAVALRVSADQAVIHRCRIDAYQDSLYTHTGRQFYRDCYITGTIDFIFGNAAVVLQNCKIIPRMPLTRQRNMVTAQGRTDPNQNTGTSIQNCNITASSDLEPVKESFESYLGRPWREYSRTVVMQTYIGDLIHPAGWYMWNGDFALSTLYYGEYLNRGPGAGTSARVNWTGYHVITSAADAEPFTVAELIQGHEWLGSTGVEYIEGL